MGDGGSNASCPRGSGPVVLSEDQLWRTAFVSTQRRPGQSANERFEDLSSAWRSRFRLFFLGSLLLGIGFGVGGFLAVGSPGTELEFAL